MKEKLFACADRNEMNQEVIMKYATGSDQMKLHIWHRDRGEKMTVNKQKYKNLNRMRSFTMVLVFIILAFFLHILTKGLFLTERNISNLVRQMATTSILAAGCSFRL